MHSNLWRFQVAYLFYCKLKQRKHVKNSGNKAFQRTKEPKHTSNLSYSKFNLKLKATQSKLTFPQTLSSLGTGPRRTSSVSEVWLPRSCIAFNCSFNSLTSFELSSSLAAMLSSLAFCRFIISPISFIESNNWRISLFETTTFSLLRIAPSRNGSWWADVDRPLELSLVTGRLDDPDRRPAVAFWLEKKDAVRTEDMTSVKDSRRYCWTVTTSPKSQKVEMCYTLKHNTDDATRLFPKPSQQPIICLMNYHGNNTNQ